METSKIWLITGCSTGIGYILAETLLKNGHKVAVTARNLDKIGIFQGKYPENALLLTLDVNDLASIQNAVQQAITHFGKIDVLVNNAGYGLMGAVEEMASEDIRNLFETNVFGLYEVTRAVLPQMRKQKSGHIINIASMAGFVASAGFSAYAATKFSVEAISESLQREVAHLGIKVTIIEPGAFRTDWAGRSFKFSENEIEDYNASSGKLRDLFKGNYSGNQKGDPEKAANAIMMIAAQEKPPLHLALGNDALERIRMKLKAVEKDLDEWEHISKSMEFDS